MELPESLIAKDQPEYNTLPAYRDADGSVLSRWRLSWRERLRVLIHGDVYVWVQTFNHPLQPILLDTERPKLG